MNLSCSSKMIKYLMFVFNLIFVITGIILIAIGASVKAYYYPYETFLDDKYFSLPNMLIATGALIFFVAFFGCCGAIKENWVMLTVFTVLVIIIFIFEFSAGIAGYVLRDKTASYLESRLNETMFEYPNNSETQAIWDVLQRGFQCCGVSKYTDWANVFNNDTLPLSCCPAVSGSIGSFYCNAAVTSATVAPTTAASARKRREVISPEDPHKIVKRETDATSGESTTATPTEATEPTTKNASATTTTVFPPSSSSPYDTGCEDAFGAFVRKHAVQIGGCAMALAVMQFVGILFSCHLARQLKNGYYST